MKFDTQSSGTAVTLTVREKKLDSAVAGELKGEFLILCTPKVKTLTVDLAQVEFCDSSGLSVLGWRSARKTQTSHSPSGAVHRRLPSRASGIKSTPPGRSPPLSTR